MANRCCQCSTNPDPALCRTTITSADIAELIYLAGLDENLCEKFTPVVPGLSLVDCAGNPIVIGQAVVTCAEFRDQLCETLLALDAGAVAVPGVTELIGNDCLTHVIPAQVPLAVVDTTCVDLTITPTIPQTLQADLILSPDPDNVLVCQPNGLYAPSACEQFDAYPPGPVAVPGVTALIGADCATHVLPAATDVSIVAIDTPCLDLTVTEGPDNAFIIQGAPVVSPNAGNALSCVGNGLYVPASVAEDIIIVGTDTPCFDITVNEAPANTFTISGTPIISPNPGNILSCDGNGLFVPEGTTPDPVVIQAVDNGCIELDAVESPDNTWTITPTLVISPNAGNVASCLDNGLYVPPGAFDLTCDAVIESFTDNAGPIPEGVQFLADDCNTYPLPEVLGGDTSTVDITVTEIGNNYVITAAVILDPDYPGYPANCSSLVDTGSGLATPPEHFSFNGQTVAGPQVVNANGIQTGENFTGPVHTINIPSIGPCRSASLMLLIDIPAFELSGLGSGVTAANATIIENAALPGVFTIVNNPLNTSKIFRKDVSVGEDSISATIYPKSTFTRQFTLPPGFVGGTYSVQVSVTMIQSDPPGSHMSLDDSKVSFFLVSN